MRSVVCQKYYHTPLIKRASAVFGSITAFDAVGRHFGRFAGVSCPSSVRYYSVFCFVAKQTTFLRTNVVVVAILIHIGGNPMKT